MKVITIINQKGGVAKTTTSQNLSYALVKKGYKVLAIDLDSQQNLSYIMNASIMLNFSLARIKSKSNIGCIVSFMFNCSLNTSNIVS